MRHRRFPWRRGDVFGVHLGADFEIREKVAEGDGVRKVDFQIRGGRGRRRDRG